MRQVKQKAAKYVLLDPGEGDGVKRALLYREVTGELARCIKEDEVERILCRYHDSHGHFAQDMTLKMLRGRYYWPSRNKDTSRYVRSCDACQRFGPLRTKGTPLKTILNLQPMDMLGAVQLITSSVYNIGND